MPLSTAEIDTLLTSWASSAAYMSAHSAYSATGGNELSGGSYARVAITWASASGASVSLSGTPYSINAPASSSVGWVGFWTASTAGTFLGMIPGGNFTGYTFTCPSSTDTALAPGSGYSNTNTAVVFPTAGSVLPSPLAAGTVYYVVSASGDSFEFAATSGGSAINITADGSGIVQQIAVESFTSAGVYQVTGGSITGV